MYRRFAVLALLIFVSMIFLWQLQMTFARSIKIPADNDMKGTAFEDEHVLATVAGAHGVFAADLDADGDMDVLSASADDGRIAWYENNGATEPLFTAHTITTDTERPLRVQAADINGDGYVDVVSASRIDGKIAWYANDGGQPPLFAATTITEGLEHAVSVDIVDLDGDNDLDVLSGAYNMPIAWYENSGGEFPTFTMRPIFTETSGVFAIRAVDVDGDDDMDVVGGSANTHLYWFENDGAVPPVFIPHVVAEYLYSQHVYAADVNGDGDIDLLATSGAWWNNNIVAWYENDGTTIPSFTPHTITSNTMRTKFVYTADIDNDGDLDVFSASQDDDKIAWYENDGLDPPTFVPHIVSEVADGARSLFVEDLNGDSHLDLLFASFEDGKVAWHAQIPPLYELLLPIVYTSN